LSVLRSGHGDSASTPGRLRRLVVATADLGTLSDTTIWYLVTNLPWRGSPREAHSPGPPTSPAEVVRIYGTRN
jgi:hypothetical protein